MEAVALDENFLFLKICPFCNFRSFRIMYDRL
jgi:hypothetical protein